MPSSSLFDLYLPRATEIPWLNVTAGIRGLLAPGVNPYGPTSAQGIYHVRVPAVQLKIDNWRLLATPPGHLRQRHAGASRAVGALGAAPLRPADARCRGPAVRLTLDSSGFGVSELAASVNLNPAAAPYGGASDADQTDVYLVQVKGIVHAIGTGSLVELALSLRFNGVVLTDGSIVVGDSLLNLLVNASLTADPTLFAQPPDGYTIGDHVCRWTARGSGDPARETCDRDRVTLRREDTVAARTAWCAATTRSTTRLDQPMGIEQEGSLSFRIRHADRGLGDEQQAVRFPAGGSPGRSGHT